MRVLVTGVGGQLGHDVINQLKAKGHTAIGTDIKDLDSVGCEYHQLDITDLTKVEALIEQLKVDAVIHCAAWTAVDAAEDEANKDIVFSINVTGTENIAKACNKMNIKMMYISTDYVFNGQGEAPWEPDDKQYAPLNYYGKTKLLGEQCVAKLVDKFFIVRIAWVFGLNGNNFIRTMLKLGKKLPELRVVNDQIGTPTYTRDLAVLLVQMIETQKYGYYHATNEGGFISWYDFAKEIFRQAKIDINVIPVSSVEYGAAKANRPFNSRLDKSKLKESGFDLLPSWEDALNRYLIEIGEINGKD